MCPAFRIFVKVLCVCAIILPMFRARPNSGVLLKKIFFFIVCSIGPFLVGCSSNPSVEEAHTYEHEFDAGFEETWRAVQQAIISYPLKVNNMELGQVQTTAIRGNSQFHPPHEPKAKGGGHRYYLTINVIKLNPHLTRVTILKDVAVYRDFVSKPEAKASDGYEENMILYRIGREIDIEKILLRESKKREKKKR